MSQALRVLVIEDSEDDCALLLRELKRGGYEPSHQRVDTAETLSAALESQPWDIIFGDYTMPRFTGTQALAMVRSRRIDVPFIFVSGTIGEDMAVAAMKAGAQDYIMKSSLKRLLPAVERELREAAQRRESARAEAERRASEARFHNMLMIAADAVITIDEDQRITVFNQGAEKIFGYSAEEVLGQLLDLLLPSRFGAAHHRHVQAFARAPENARRMKVRGEIYGRRKNGEEFPAEANISKLTENGKTTFTVILRDVTERKRAERELRLLESITQDASEAGDVHAALAVTLDKVCETTGWTLAQAWVPGASGNVLECSPAWYGREAGLEDFRTANLGYTFAAGEELPGRVWTSRQSLWVHDVSGDTGLHRASLACQAGLKSGMGIPVLAGDEVVAVIEFFMREPRDADKRLLELVSSVAAQLGSVVQRKRTEERLHYLAHHDALTGLPNRALFMDRLRQALFEARRHERSVGIASLDLDRFNTINDSLGHGVGDLFLQNVSERLLGSVREGDTVARLAGDEFVVILTDLGHVDHAPRLAQKILDSVARPFRVAGHELYTSASLGMTLYPLDGDDGEALLRNADMAMYRAKEEGPNTFRFYQAGMNDKAVKRITLEHGLRQALEREEFLLHYQPQADARTGEIVGMEALVRWNRPEQGMVSPGDFIPLAEETGLIVPLGEWVLREACRQNKVWQDAGLLPVRVGVNISARQFRQQNMFEVVARILEETGLAPQYLELELTESLVMDDPEHVIETMMRLKGLGVQLALDDFGTGYSSLRYLKRFPIDRVKIDRSFVRDITEDADDAAIALTVISMGHSLGLKVIAEGVETASHLEFLRAHGCDEIQGYYLARPAAADEAVRMLRGDGSAHKARAS